MGCVGEEQALPPDEGFDPLGGGVEAPGEHGHLVAPLYRHAAREVALAEGLHPFADGLDATREAPRQGVRAGRDEERDPQEGNRKTAVGPGVVARAQPEPTSVVEAQLEGRRPPPRSATDVFPGAVGGQRGPRPPGGRHTHPIGAPKSEVEVQAMAPRFEECLGLCRRLCLGKILDHDLGEAPGHLAREAPIAPEERAEHRRRDHDHHQDREKGEVDLDVQAPHAPASSSPGSRAKRYPTPRRVWMRRGRFGSSSIAARMREMWTSMLRSNAPW